MASKWQFLPRFTNLYKVGAYINGLRYLSVSGKLNAMLTSSDSSSTTGTCCHGSLSGAKGIVIALYSPPPEVEKNRQNVSGLVEKSELVLDSRTVPSGTEQLTKRTGTHNKNRLMAEGATSYTFAYYLSK